MMMARASPPNREHGGEKGLIKGAKAQKLPVPMAMRAMRSAMKWRSERKERTKVKMGESRKLMRRRSKIKDRPNPG